MHLLTSYEIPKVKIKIQMDINQQGIPKLIPMLCIFRRVCRRLDGIHILCASFWPVIHLPEENPGGVIILLSTEGLGAKWRKE